MANSKYPSNSFPVERVRELYDYDYETGYLISKKGNYPGRPVKGSLRYGHQWNIHLHSKDGTSLGCNYGRVVFCWHYGRWPEGSIDHIDRDPRNNRVDNLREADDALQIQNRGNFNYGAYWRKASQKWAARIYVNGKDEFLGLYESLRAAQEAYMAACDEIGKFYLPPALVEDRYVPAERLQ